MIDAAAPGQLTMAILPGAYQKRFSRTLDYMALGHKKLGDFIRTMPSIKHTGIHDELQRTGEAAGGIGNGIGGGGGGGSSSSSSSSNSRSGCSSRGGELSLRAWSLADVEQQLLILIDAVAPRPLFLPSLVEVYQGRFGHNLITHSRRLNFATMEQMIDAMALVGRSSEVAGGRESVYRLGPLAALENQLLLLIDAKPPGQLTMGLLLGAYEERFHRTLDYKVLGYKRLGELIDAMPRVTFGGSHQVLRRAALKSPPKGKHPRLDEEEKRFLTVLNDKQVTRDGMLPLAKLLGNYETRFGQRFRYHAVG